MMPDCPAAMLNGLSVDAALLMRFVTFAKALGLEPNLSIGFHGEDQPFTVRIKNLSAFYGMLMPAEVTHSVEAPPIWWTQQNKTHVVTEADCSKSSINIPQTLPLLKSVVPIVPIDDVSDKCPAIAKKVHSIHLHHLEGETTFSGTDDKGLVWSQFIISELSDEVPAICAICRQEINTGWHCIDNGDEICNCHVTIPIDPDNDEPIDLPVPMPVQKMVSNPEEISSPSLLSIQTPVQPEILRSELAETMPIIVQTGNPLVGQMVTYQGQQYPVLKIDGDWANLDTSVAGKSSWRTVRKSLVTPISEDEVKIVPMPPINTIVASQPTQEVPNFSNIDTVALGRKIYTYLNSGENFTSKRDLQIFVAGELGVEPSVIFEAIKHQEIDSRGVEEAYEYSQVLRARDLAQNSLLSHEEIFQRFVDNYDRQLSISQRDSTVTSSQQYSTPLPLCYLIGRYLGLDKAGLIYEPTAGNGSLLIFADPNSVIVNELDKGPRLAALKDQKFQQIFNEDALIIPAYHPELLRQMDAVVMNPPFETMDKSVQYQGYKITKLEHFIALRSLELMKDGGKAAIIIGGHNFHDRYGCERAELPVSDSIFFNYLYSHYHVVRNIDINGILYRKQGTTFPVRLLLIEGRNTTPVEGFAAPRDASQVQRVATWEELAHLLTPPVREAEEGVGRKNTAVIEPESIETSNNRGIELKESSAISNRNVLTHQPATTTPTVEVTLPASFPIQYETNRISVGHSIKTLSAHANMFQAQYRPVSEHPGQTEYLSPKNLSEPQRVALEQIKYQHGSIDGYVQRELRYETLDALYNAFHAAQIDGIALALSNLSSEGGMIIGDGTGVGKGREAAAIIYWAKTQGKLPIFFTQNPKLFSDIYSDLKDIGKRLTPFIMNRGTDAHIVDMNGKVLVRAEGSAAVYQQIASLGVNAPALQGCDFLVVNYPQINRRDNVQRLALQRLAEGNVIILDESHNASGDSGTGQFVRDNLLKTASGVLYLSATYAKRPNTMPLYYRTDIGNAGLSLPQLIEAIEHGGVALQQVIAADLAKGGQYIRRELDFSQIEFYRVTIDYSHETRDMERSDAVTEILRDLVQFDLTKAEQVDEMHKKARKNGRELGKIDGTKTTSAGVTSTNFTATVHNIIGQMLLAIKADNVVDRAIAASQHADPSQRKKVVIGLMNTLESHLKALIESGDLALGQQVAEYSFKEVLKKALRNTLRYRVKDHTGNSTAYQFAVPGVFLANAKMGMPLDSVSEEMFFELMDKIERMRIDLPGSPIDYMLHKMQAAGLRVGELTGRTYTFDAEGILTARTGNERNKNSLVNRFNAGDLDVLIINAAGATGLSIHSSPKFRDQTPRLMLVPQSQLNIDTELQLYGRINRTGQVNGPAFEILQTALPSEIRPAAILQGKMASINANTSANDESHFSLKDIPDMMNKYGDEIVQTYLNENPDVYLMIGEPDTDQALEHGAFFRKVSGRIALAPVDIQRAFYEIVEQRYRQTIAYLDQMGSNDLVTKDYDFQAKTIFKIKAQEGTDETNAFKSSVFVEEVSAKVLKKPYLRARVERDANANKQLTEKVLKDALCYGNEYLALHQKNLLDADPEKRITLEKRIRDIKENIQMLEMFTRFLLSRKYVQIDA